MGIRRRIIWLILGMLLCRLCVGCGEKEIEDVGSIISLVGSAQRPLEEVVISTPKPVEKSGIQRTLEEVAGSTPKPMEESSTQRPLEEVLDSVPKPKEEMSSSEESLEEVTDIASKPKEEKNSSKESTPKPKKEVSSTTSPAKEEYNTPCPAVEIVVSSTPKPTNEPDILPSQTITEANVHTHTVVVEKKDATCLGTGVEREYCEVCKLVLTEKIQEPLEHDFVKSVWELPTCQKGGYYNNICSRCGLVECVSQEALPHEVEDILVQEGNCMEDTVIQHICRICGMQAEAETRYTPYDVHSWTVAEIDGILINYCERCGVSE